MNWETFKRKIQDAVAGSTIVANLIEAILADDRRAIAKIIESSPGKYEEIEDFVCVIREAAIPYSGRRGLWYLIDIYRYNSKVQIDDLTLRRAYNLYKSGKRSEKSPQIQLLESWLKTS